MKKLCFFILCSFVFSHFQFSRAQRNSVYIAYIQKYKEYAIEQMMRYKIPASITLAQGLLESGAGQSTLARKANNHFGIKCGSGWKGKYFIQDDDYKNERFRVYRNVKESYHDHSLFLIHIPHSIPILFYTSTYLISFITNPIPSPLCSQKWMLITIRARSLF